MKGKYYWLILGLILLVPLAGCGSGGDGCAPGSGGSTDTGICIQAVSIVGNPTSTDMTPDIDVNVHLCPPDFTESEEGLFRVDATITIDAKALNPDPLFDPFPASVEECTITYKKANQDPAPPIIEYQTHYSNCPIREEEENECIVNLIDIDRKVEFWDDLLGGLNLPAEYPTHYTAVYKCIYQNRYGKSGYFQVEYDIWLADFETC